MCEQYAPLRMVSTATLRIRRKWVVCYSMHDPIQLLKTDLQHLAQAQLAKKIGISAQQLSDVLNERREPRGRILDYYGLEMCVTYREKVRTNGKSKR